jgi:uncharacterized protein (DUF362 family)/Pyruvate/2-oxoacid:ferredoxin oxidoreductase delta subunit
MAQDRPASAGSSSAAERARVAVVRAGGYDLSTLRAALKEGAGLIGGLEHVIRPGTKVFVKINHLSPPSPPEHGIVTHPVFLEAVLELLSACGASVTVGDDIDPGPRDGYQVTGVREVCRRAGVVLVNLRETGFAEVECQGTHLERVYVAKAALDADVIVDLPKLKTHSLVSFTGGVKNMYGCVPRGTRVENHYIYQRNADFSQMLVDIFSVLRPHLTIMDGVVAMEGDGPAGGQLVELGLILLGEDAVATDAVAGQIVGMDPRRIYTTRYCHDRGLGVGDLARIDIVGEELSRVIAHGFRLPAAYSTVTLRRVPRFVSRLVYQHTLPFQHVQEGLCTGCFECLKICPAGAIIAVDGIARVDHSKCIHCRCCGEVCRDRAMTTRAPLAGRALGVARGLRSALRGLRDGVRR